MEDSVIKSVIKNKMPLSKVIFILIFFGVFIYDLFYSGGDYRDRTIFIEFILWFLIVILFRLKSMITFLLSLGFLMLYCYYLFFNNNVNLMARVSVWLYITLVFGIIHQAFELKKKR